MLDNSQILYASNSLLIVILGFFIRGWMGNIKETLDKITHRLDNMDKELVNKEDCKGHHRELRRCAHTHATSGGQPLGSAGAVVQS